MTQHTSRSVGVGIVTLVGIGSFWLAGGEALGASSRGIDWRPELSRAQAEARSTQRLLWIQFTGPWCQFCHRMDREAFVQPRVVGEARDHFVPVKLQSDAHEDLIGRFRVEGLPATIILAPSGELVAKHEGYVDGATFAAFLESARSRFDANRGPAVAVGASVRTEVDVALAGFCPVSLVQDHRLVPGQDGVSLQHEGRVYRFANPAVRGAFERQPERFIPVNGGRCPVQQVDRGDSRNGDPRYGILYQGHLYLCADETSRGRFLKNPERYSHVDLADRSLCPHCWGHDYVVAGSQSTGSWVRFSTLPALAGGTGLDPARPRDATVRR